MLPQPYGLDPITAAPNIELPSIHGIRRENLGALLKSFSQAQLAAGMPPKGLEQAFAARIQISPSMLSQIKRSRNISNSLATQIECLSGKSDGWLSQPHPTADSTNSTQAEFTEEDLIDLVRKTWRSANAQQREQIARTVRRAVSSLGLTG